MTKHPIYYDGDEFNRGGRVFKIEFPVDESHEPPWENDCGSGIVSDWTRRAKAPGERLLCEDRGGKRFYDWQETMKIAKRDGWGLRDEEKAALASRLGRAPTRKQVIAEAVERDFERIRQWCNDQWQYVGVVVTDLESEECESLWGVESDCRDYLRDVAHELADEINARLDEIVVADIAASRPGLAPEGENLNT